MKRNNHGKKFCAILIFALFLGLSITSTVVSDKISYVNLIYTPHDPIYINGNNEFISENGVTGGSGTSNDPFVIEGWEINASSMDGITIRNVSVFFEIRNCYVHNGGVKNDGIVFINVTNGVIEDTIITGNRNGTVFRTQYTGKENSENNSIRHNNINFNTYDGIHFEHTGWGYHSNNIISNNNLSGNKRGVYMIMSADNQILYNNIISNDEIGILLDMCVGGGENNRIYHNNFIDNGDENGQACERGGPLNYWDDGYPSGGNYWSDYMGIDNFSGPDQDIPGSDGIGDTPYPIPDDDNEDRYPLMEPWGGENQPPSVEIINPKKGYIHISGIPLFPAYFITLFDAMSIGGFRLRPIIINATDDIDESEDLIVNIYLNGNYQGNASYCCDWRKHEWFWTGFAFGLYNLTITVEDSYGACSSDEMIVWNFCLLP